MTGAFGQTITIYHTNNNNGTLENCYCPDHPLGSIEKRLAYLKEARKKDPNLILLDAGDLFSVSERQAFKDSLVAEAYALTGYDAIVPGDQELFRDEAFLANILPLTGAKMVISNLGNEVPFETVPYLILERKGIKIGIIGVVDQEVFRYYSDDVKNKMNLLSPAEVVPDMVKEIEGKTDLVVLLSHQGHEKDLELADKISGVDIIIGGHTQTVVENPGRNSNIFVAQAGKEGYYLGKITVNLDEGMVRNIVGELIPMTIDMPDDQGIMELITIYETTTGHINPRKKELSGSK